MLTGELFRLNGVFFRLTRVPRTSASHGSLARRLSRPVSVVSFRWFHFAVSGFSTPVGCSCSIGNDRQWLKASGERLQTRGVGFYFRIRTEVSEFL